MLHPSAMISPEARLGRGVSVGPFAVIEPDTIIGDRCEIRAHAVIKRYTTLGADNLIHEGAVLGGEPQDLAFAGAPSRLLIGDRNVFREGVTVHRATQRDGQTVVGSDCFLMANAHVAHECVIGDRVIMANDALLSGHIQVGERAFISGCVVVQQFSKIGRLALLGGGSKVPKDCLPFVITDGNPARARGLNVVGLRRAGFTAPQLRALKQAFQLLLRSGLPLQTALAKMAELHDPNVDEMIVFCRESKRGFHKGVRMREDQGIE
jgi:UDP-N-acetylglucosamine acyltransferase